jgi:hypothetical protein
MVMFQGSAALHCDEQGTKRGDRQPGATDWEMVMAMRPVGGGMLQLRAMSTLEPFVLSDGGYPQLLQTGGTHRHSPLRDRQHPHNALIELATLYEHVVTRGVAASLYAAAVGEPALGPVAYMHRPSALEDPFAPLGHHWQDAAHQSFGVVTLGINSRQVKLEGSLFNPRESDEHHPFVDVRDARLDSYAGRISWAAGPRLTASAWWGYLNSHERLDPTTRMHRFGGSLLSEAHGPGGGRWSSAIIWGTNVHHHGAASHALIHGDPNASPHHRSSSLLAESTLQLGKGIAVFARLERVEKNGAELGFFGGDLTTLYDLRSAVGGVTRRVAAAGGAELSLGVRGAVNFVPETLLATYGTRTPTGFAVFVRLRPRVDRAAHM